MRNTKRSNKKKTHSKEKKSKKKVSKKPPFRPYGKTDALESIYEKPVMLSDLGDQAPREKQITEDIERIELDLTPVSEDEKTEVKKILSD